MELDMGRKKYFILYNKLSNLKENLGLPQITYMSTVRFYYVHWVFKFAMISIL